MIKTLFRKKFDQNSKSELPPGAQRIVHDVARKFLMSNRSAKHHEFAHASLYMQLYQRFGRRTNTLVPGAIKTLHEIVGPRPAV